MAVIYMKHPDHGAKVAISEMEAELDEMNGWVRYNDGATLEPVNELSFARRGRRPAKREE